MQRNFYRVTYERRNVHGTVLGDPVVFDFYHDGELDFKALAFLRMLVEHSRVCGLYCSSVKVIKVEHSPGWYFEEYEGA